MPNHNDPDVSDPNKTSGQIGQQQANLNPPTKSRVSKEQETRAEEDKIMAEIHTTAEAYDKQKLGEVEALIKEAKRAQVEPQIPADVEDAGVVHPQTEAEKVVQKGSTLELPVSEEAYNRGLHKKVVGAVVNKVVVGVTSLAALAMWIGRLVKIAHKHAMRVVFKKPSSAPSTPLRATEGKEVN